MTIQPSQTGQIVGLAIAMTIIIWRNAKARRLKVELLWIRPAIMCFFAVMLMLYQPPKTPLMIAACAGALLTGAVVGWFRGKLMRITVDPQTHTASVQGSIVAVVLILAIIFIKAVINILYPPQAGGAHPGVNAASNALLLFAVGMVAVQGVEMFLRARRLVSESRASAAAGEVAA